MVVKQRQRSPGIQPRPVWALGRLTARVLVSIFVLALLGLLSFLPSHLGSLRATPVNGLLFVTHGGDHVTPLMGCIAEQVAKHMEKACGHGMTLITSINGSSSSANILNDAAGFSYMVELAKASMEEHFGLARPPYLIMRAPGTVLSEVCYDSAQMSKDALFVRHMSTHSSAPGRVCLNGCPCHDGISSCLEFGSCFVSHPMSDGLLRVHVIVNPVDSVLHSYRDNIRVPPEETWVDELKIGSLGLELELKGVRRDFLASLGLMEKNNANLTYGQMLRKLSEDDGVFLELLRSAPGLYKSARIYLHLSTSLQSSNNLDLVLRARDIIPESPSSVAALITSLTPMLKGLGSSCLSSLSTREVISQMAKICSLDDQGEIVRERMEVDQRRAEALLKHPYAADIVLRLEGAMGISKYSLGNQ